MRRLTDSGRIDVFLKQIGRCAEGPVRVYLTGGATAVLLGWRESTIDIDLKIVPESDTILREIPRLKDELEINVELASPDQFIPTPTGWMERSPFVRQEGRVAVHHYDLYSQALAKIERGHVHDLKDAGTMVERGLVEVEKLRELFIDIEPRLYRFPAIDPPSFRRAVDEFISSQQPSRGDRR